MDDDGTEAAVGIRGDLVEAGAYVVSLRRCGSLGVNRVGSKARNLGQLLSQSFPVPDGFVLTTEAFDRFLVANGLGASSSAHEILRGVFPEELRNAVLDASVSLGTTLWAVRSSGVSEDLPGASYAGQYETVLGVAEDALERAIRTCWASAFSDRVSAYRAGRDLGTSAGMAVLVQVLVQADSSGVAFTAEPTTGDRSVTVVSATRGLGERLVSGEAAASEWTVTDQVAKLRGGPATTITAAEARSVAQMAKRVESFFGSPQDVEWAIAHDDVFVLQARPITALPDSFDWAAPLPGVWLRNFRFGEWIGDPVTPLFETWLLSRLEERMFAYFHTIIKVPVPRPFHVAVNGWYFMTANIVPTKKSAIAAMMFRYFLPALILRPRRTMTMIKPSKIRLVKFFLRQWRESVLPRYRAVVATAEAAVDSASLSELVRCVDEVADAAGDYFNSLIMVAGFAWKSELPLAEFYRANLTPRIGGTHQRLLRGLASAPRSTPPHTTIGLDWFFPTIGDRTFPTESADAADRSSRVAADRRAAEREARESLAGQPRRLRQFERLLEAAQKYALIREEHVSSFTLGWPFMRKAVLRLGRHLRERGLLAEEEDAFFLSRDELVASLEGTSGNGLEKTVRERRRVWEQQRRLSPPLMLGEMSPFLDRALGTALRGLGASKPAEAHAVTGMAASPGRATGPVRVIRRVEEFDLFRSGDILVSPATTPAWTPLFTRAAAIVTDVGSLVAHASLVAREYGIPAVVATGDATSRLKDGQVVTVDGTQGTVDLSP